MSRENFFNSIKLKRDGAETEIENLQSSFKSGDIMEEDIPKEKLDKLIHLYEKQNKELEDKIDEAKIRIKRKLNSIK